ncbi:hypothetical protein KGA66_26560 [Actinocrinis puniceicyclus]|uniref:Uncharacterized protein n=1 Tax=Actinocrinis puniceicyclus TaxID=977794 RepID=A0A8J7WUC4_9ACTN|nr:hypothetical protein [Actinocrinis puniceicyclus]MBS2966627.1 hypothetical protein [Actinocrinis puniceicyclus]
MCGTTIEPPTAASSSQDPVQLAITKTTRSDTSVSATYQITSPIKTEMLNLSVRPTPPTILLIHNATIAGFHRTTDTIDGSPATGFPIGTRPYAGSLAIDTLCPNATWTQIWQNPAEYQLEIVMSRQPTSGQRTAPPASYITDPLTTAVAPLPQ